MKSFNLDSFVKVRLTPEATVVLQMEMTENDDLKQYIHSLDEGNCEIQFSYLIKSFGKNFMEYIANNTIEIFETDLN